MGKNQQGLSNNEYAKRCGLSRAYIGRLVHRGAIPVLPDGSIDPAAADAARAKNVGLRPGPPARASRGDSYWQARTVKEHYAAKLLQLEYARESGKVLDADKVLELLTQAFSNCRTRLRGVGKSLAPVLQHRNVAEIEQLLSAGIDGALLSLSDDVLGPCAASGAESGPQVSPSVQ